MNETVPSLLFDLRPNYGGGNEDNGNLLQKIPMHTLPTSVPLTLQQAPTNPCLRWRLLDTPRQVWVSLLGKKVMTNLDSILESRDITLPTKIGPVKAMVFPVVMYGCES